MKHHVPEISDQRIRKLRFGLRSLRQRADELDEFFHLQLEIPT